MRSLITILVPCVVTLVGCGGATSPSPVVVTGTVQLDKQPLSEGEILFKIPGETPQIVSIKDGKFSTTLTPGKRDVEILAYRQAQDFNMGGVIIKGSRENYVDEKFNTHTTLTAEITTDGPNEFSFSVTSRSELEN